MPCKTCIPLFTPTPELTHFGKETCQQCGKFLRWVPKPQNIEKQKTNADAVVKLRNDDRLSAWERGFVATLDTQGPKVSPKQQAILDKLIAKFLQ